MAELHQPPVTQTGQDISPLSTDVGKISVSTAAEIVNLLHSNDPEAHTAFLTQAQAQAAAFTKDFKDLSNPKEPKRDQLLTDKQLGLINEWMNTEHGKGVVSALTDDVIMVVASPAGAGHPGHDRRHVLIKDPVAGLRLAAQDNIDDCRSLYLLAALLHDVGRLPEPLIDAGSQSGVMGKVHGQYGFLLFKRILDSHLDNAQATDEQRAALLTLKNELLNAVLDHQTGNSRTSFFAQAVQRADREQLIGPEMILRSLAYDVGIYGLSLNTSANPDRNNTLPLPGTQDDRDYSHHVEFYARNLFPNVGSQGPVEAERLKVMTGTFLQIISTPEQQKQIFHPELAREQGEDSGPLKFKNAFQLETWDRIKAGPSPDTRAMMELIMAGKSASELALNLLRSDFAASNDTIEAKVLAQLDGLPPEVRDRYREGFAYAIAMRDQLDSIDRELIHATVKQYSDRQYLPQYRIARAINEQFGDG